MFILNKCSSCNEYKLLDDFGKGNRIFGKHNICKLCTKKYYDRNKEKKKLYGIEYAILNKEKRKEYSKAYYNKNKNKIRLKNIEWRNNNKHKIRQYVKQKRESDHMFKLTANIRNLIYSKIKNKGYIKNDKVLKILGCDFDSFKHYIENKFLDGMTWENYGKWHLDHIYPASLAKDEQHLIELNHYTNFQPLWAKDNIRKGNKIIEKQLFYFD